MVSLHYPPGFLLMYIYQITFPAYLSQGGMINHQLRKLTGSPDAIAPQTK